jgi:hypothetical protein
MVADQPAIERVHQPGLAEAGVAEQGDEARLTLNDPRPGGLQDAKLVIATDKRASALHYRSSGLG